MSQLPEVSPAIIPVVDEGLGNSSYVVDLGDGSVLVVDPPRDLRAVRSVVEAARLRVRFVADTHLHADFLSGALQLAHDDGAQVLAAATGRRSFAHRGLRDSDQVDLGGLRLTTMATPGHTDEHVAFVLLDGEHPLGVFTGGSLIVGSAARTDLLGPERAEELASAQYGSLRRVAMLPEPTLVWPTHGAGSFCSAPPAAERISTIGRELATNPLLRAPDEATFVRTLLGSLGSYPPYFARLGEVNRRGPRVLPAQSGALAPITAAHVARRRADGALVVDVRPVPDYAAMHIPAALSIPLRGQFATWLGWLAPPDTPLIIVRNDDQDPAEVIWQALKVGYEWVAGELAGGMPAWSAAGHSTAAIELVTAQDLGGRRVLDIRQRPDFTDGHLPNATNVELGYLAATANQLPHEPTVVMCGHGERAAGGASLLEAAGRSDVAVLIGGPEDWARVTGGALASDS